MTLLITAATFMLATAALGMIIGAKLTEGEN